MSRKVTVSTIGPYNVKLSTDGSVDTAVEEVIDHLKAKIDQVLPDQPDLICLPELCDQPDRWSGMHKRQFYEERGTRVRDALAELARQHQCYIVYPHCRKMEEETYRNSILLLDRNGEDVGYYDKNYPVVPNETVGDGIVPGTEAVVLQCDFGTVGFVICFDLNYDDLRRKYEQLRPDLIVFSSMYHGGLMQAYWAYSCRAHFVGAIAFEPLSTILSPLGEQLAASTNYYDYVTKTINLDCAVIHLDNHFDKLYQMRKKYGQKVSVIDPGNLGAVLISSESDEFTVEDLLAEFEFTRIDDYLQISAEAHNERCSKQ